MTGDRSFDGDNGEIRSRARRNKQTCCAVRLSNGSNVLLDCRGEHQGCKPLPGGLGGQRMEQRPTYRRYVALDIRLGFEDMRRRLPIFFACTAVHFILAMAIFAWSYSVSSDAFDGRAVSWLGRYFAPAATSVLWFPVLPLSEIAGTRGFTPSPLVQWAFLVFNSALWGLIAMLVHGRLRSGAQVGSKSAINEKFN